jgi:predicted Zn-dependent protease
MNLTMTPAALLTLSQPPSPPARTAPPTGDARSAIEALLDSPQPRKRARGEKLLFDRAVAAPHDFDALEGGARALFLRASWATDRASRAALAKRCWTAADKLVTTWPKRAHGYYWSALCIGQYAASTDLQTALGQGLAGKMEAMAYASIAREPALYAKGAQRLLGCFFIRAPWPIGDTKKAVAYLNEATAADPKDANGLLCLSEALAAAGDEAGAREALKRCAGLVSRDTAAVKTCAERLDP